MVPHQESRSHARRKISFPRSAWECTAGRSASIGSTLSVGERGSHAEHGNQNPISFHALRGTHYPDAPRPSRRPSHHCVMTGIRPSLSSVIACAGVSPVNGIIDITAYNRIVMNILKLLPHMSSPFNHLRVAAFLPKLISLDRSCDSAFRRFS